MIYSFMDSRHTAWLCLNFTTVTWPLYVALVPYLTLKYAGMRDSWSKKSSWFTSLKNSWTGFFMLSCFMIVYLFIIDFIFMIIALVTIPLVMLMIACRCRFVIRFESAIDWLCNKLFGIREQDVEGLRRMRTST